MQGINLSTLLWTEGDRHLLLDHRFYEKSVDRATKNDCPLCEVELASSGTLVHLKGYGYGFVKVFRIVTPDGDLDYWATNDIHLSELKRLQFAEFGWAIEEYHWGLKQCCGAEHAYVSSSCAQRNYIGLAIRGFLRLEWHWFATGISWCEAKLAIVRDAIRFYLAAPGFVLNPTT